MRLDQRRHDCGGVSVTSVRVCSFVYSQHSRSHDHHDRQLAVVAFARSLHACAIHLYKYATDEKFFWIMGTSDLSVLRSIMQVCWIPIPVYRHGLRRRAGVVPVARSSSTPQHLSRQQWRPQQPWEYSLRKYLLLMATMTPVTGGRSDVGRGLHACNSRRSSSSSRCSAAATFKRTESSTPVSFLSPESSPFLDWDS